MIRGLRVCDSGADACRDHVLVGVPLYADIRSGAGLFLDTYAEYEHNWYNKRRLLGIVDES